MDHTRRGALLAVAAGLLPNWAAAAEPESLKLVLLGTVLELALAGPGGAGRTDQL